MSDNESDQSVDSAYINTLKSQIAEKKELLQVAKELLQKTSNKKQENDPRDEILSLIEVLKRLPYNPARNDVVDVSLAKAQLTSENESLDRLTKQLKDANSNDLEAQENIHRKLLVLYDRLDKFLDKDLSEKERKRTELLELRQDDKTMDDYVEEKYTNLEEYIHNLRTRSLKLTEFTRILVDEYILKNELPVFESDEQLQHKKRKFLQLLELLLNNKLMSPENGREKTVLVASKDDPLIRYLLVNNIATVDRRDSNRIRLMM